MRLLSAARAASDQGDAQAAPAPGAFKILPDLAAGLTLAAGLAVLYHQVLDLWWSHDDFFHLHYIAAHRPWEYCLDPRVWQLLPFRMLTPWLFVSLDCDLRLFGADPHAFYSHQLVAAVLAFLALYAALRLWLSPWLAAFGTAAAFTGAPSSSLVQLLMLRHYVEGLFMASLSVFCFVRGLRRQRALDRYLSALLYLAASLGKEIFVPLVILFPLLVPMATARRRLGLVAPHLGAFLLYLGWRQHMLGTLGGGYGWSVAAADLPGLALALPHKIVQAITAAAPGPGYVLLSALAAGAVIGCARGRRAALLLLVALVAALGPVLPASTQMEARYALAAWLVIVIAFTFGCDHLFKTGRTGTVVAILLAGSVAITALAVHRQSWARSFAALDRMSAENRALLRLPEGQYLRAPSGPPASLHELQWFRQGYLHLPAGGGWFADDLFLCTMPPTARLLEYDQERRRVEDISARSRQLRSSFCGSIRSDVPLTADLSLAPGNLHWRLGPYDSGSYSLVVGGAARTPIRYPASPASRPLDCARSRCASTMRHRLDGIPILRSCL
jgi:hypothetical protein